MTLNFARSSQADDAPRLALGLGAIAACTVMLARVAVACAVLNPSLALLMPRYLGPAFVVGAAILLARWPTHRSTSAEAAGPESPLQLLCVHRPD